MIQLGRHQLHHGDALDVLRAMPDASVDAVVTDPPYGLGKEPDALAMLRDWLTTGSHVVTGAGFMGRTWDAFVPQPVLWAEVLRVLKPGGHALVFAGTRTQDLMGLALRIAGFEVRDCLQWIYGSGFPKHTSALKPAYEPILLCRKPLAGTVAANVQQFGTGALNIDVCRVGQGVLRSTGAARRDREDGYGFNGGVIGGSELGRWPANIVIDEEAGAALEAQSGNLGKSAGVQRNSPANKIYGRGLSGHPDRDGMPLGFGDSGGASRFFYCAKASTAERGTWFDSTESISVEWSPWENEVRKVQLQVDTAQSPPRVTCASGMPASAAIEWSTFLFGSGPMALSRQGSKCITATRTNSTTQSKTLRWLTRSLTKEGTAGVNYAKASGGNPAESAASGTQLETITVDTTGSLPGAESAASATRLKISGSAGRRVSHPTVKPLALMRWLCQLVTPPGGVILDPFAGSGTTLLAADALGFTCIAVEREAEHVGIITDRYRAVAPLFVEAA